MNGQGASTGLRACVARGMVGCVEGREGGAASAVAPLFPVQAGEGAFT